jgi:hypothetical protein
VVFGKAAGFEANLDLASLDGTSGFRLDGIDAVDVSGFSVASAGDVNGDGFDDVLVCATNRIGLYEGSSTGLGTEPLWGYARGNTPCGFGWPLGRAGDVNGDGFGDFAIAASPAGLVRVFLGSATGPGEAPDQALDVGSHVESLAALGDVNHDGFDDLAVGAPYFPDGGRALVFVGSATGLQPVPAWVNDPVPDAQRFGWSVASAGDVNGDGLEELVIGDPAVPSGFGRAHVFYGVQPLQEGQASVIDDAGLELDRDAQGQVVLSWSDSCAEDGDFAIYAGTLGDFANHEAETCTTAGLQTWTLSAVGEDSYYLIVPRSLNREGSYGFDGAGIPRAPSASACLPQAVAACN